MSHHANMERGGRGEQHARGAERLDEDIRKSLQQPPIQLGTSEDTGANENSTRSNEFPARLIPKRSHDNRIALQQEIVGGKGGTDAIYGKNVQMVMPISEKDVQWWDDKRKDQNYLAFKQWMHSTIDMSNPLEVALARQNGMHACPCV